MGVSKRVNEAGLVLGALGVIGFIGVVWLMIYGNLSGNLGFNNEVVSFENDTMTFNDSSIPPSALNRANGILTVTLVVNGSSGATVPAADYTTSGVSLIAVNPTFNLTVVNVTGSVSFDGSAEVLAEGVITNTSGGFLTFFGFSNTFFTIAAIILLIFMLVGLLAIVMLISKSQSGRKGFSG